ncbi:hypothetical protein EDB83DRAFT_2373678, partial [Lactarius deliciosus]
GRKDPGLGLVFLFLFVVVVFVIHHHNRLFAAFFICFPLGPVLPVPASCSQMRLAVRARVHSSPNCPFLC